MADGGIEGYCVTGLRLLLARLGWKVTGKGLGLNEGVLLGSGVFLGSQ